MSIELQQLTQHCCVLGEGLFIDEACTTWLDIHADEFLLMQAGILSRHKLTAKLAVIFERRGNQLRMGCDSGLFSFDLRSNDSHLRDWDTLHNNLEQFRTNDGVQTLSLGLVGFTYREEPERYAGSACRMDGTRPHLFDEAIHIPNGFVPLDAYSILICDSLEARGYLYRLHNSGDLVSKEVWQQFETGLAPDGGCRIEDSVYFALWDGYAIARLNLQGKELGRLDLLCRRPTNCKYDSARTRLLITSASEDLVRDGLQGAPFAIALAAV